MSKLTKADIDGLLTGAAVNLMIREWLPPFREAFYLAAGLTAEGGPKPEKVRVWRAKSAWSGKYCWFEKDPTPDQFLISELTPGWFVPDGAE